MLLELDADMIMVEGISQLCNDLLVRNIYFIFQSPFGIYSFDFHLQACLVNTQLVSNLPYILHSDYFFPHDQNFFYFHLYTSSGLCNYVQLEATCTLCSFVSFEVTSVTQIYCDVLVQKIYQLFCTKKLLVIYLVLEFIDNFRLILYFFECIGTNHIISYELLFMLT